MLLKLIFAILGVVLCIQDAFPQGYLIQKDTWLKYSAEDPAKAESTGTWLIMLFRKDDKLPDWKNPEFRGFKQKPWGLIIGKSLADVRLQLKNSQELEAKWEKGCKRDSECAETLYTSNSYFSNPVGPIASYQPTNEIKARVEEYAGMIWERYEEINKLRDVVGKRLADELDTTAPEQQKFIEENLAMLQDFLKGAKQSLKEQVEFRSLPVEYDTFEERGKLLEKHYLLYPSLGFVISDLEKLKAKVFEALPTNDPSDEEVVAMQAEFFHANGFLLAHEERGLMFWVARKASENIGALMGGALIYHLTIHVVPDRRVWKPGEQVGGNFKVLLICPEKDGGNLEAVHTISNLGVSADKKVVNNIPFYPESNCDDPRVRIKVNEIASTRQVVSQ